MRNFDLSHVRIYVCLFVVCVCVCVRWGRYRLTRRVETVVVGCCDMSCTMTLNSRRPVWRNMRSLDNDLVGSARRVGYKVGGIVCVRACVHAKTRHAGGGGGGGGVRRRRVCHPRLSVGIGRERTQNTTTAQHFGGWLCAPLSRFARQTDPYEGLPPRRGGCAESPLGGGGGGRQSRVGGENGDGNSSRAPRVCEGHGPESKTSLDRSVELVRRAFFGSGTRRLRVVWELLNLSRIKSVLKD